MVDAGWQKNRQLLSQGLRDLAYLPQQRCGWDCTLSSLAYGMREAINHRTADLGAWAARHGVPASGRSQELGTDALVLWHGTSRQRAEKIVQHGLFHKRGLWATSDPAIAHGFCRRRSERFGAEGAVLCLVLDGGALSAGQDFELQGKGNVYRFQHGLPPEVVEYVLTHEELHFTGRAKARHPPPWRTARFKRRSGTWLPQQQAPVRYSDAANYSSADEFARLCLDRLLAELVHVTALEVFSTLYSVVNPWAALAHNDVLDLIQQRCTPHRRPGKWQTFAARTASGASI